jgi:hypothetical protein
MAEAGAMPAGLSAQTYFMWVLVLTLAGFGGAMVARPAFGHAVLQWIGLEHVPQALPGSFYSVRVAPLFQAHCVSCHGIRREKGGLRLDSFAEVILGGRHGDVVRPGKPNRSDLYHRISLPQSDDAAMPPNGKTPLSDDEVTVIRLWIGAGASGSTLASAVKGAPKLVVPVTIPDLNPAIVETRRAPLAAIVRDLGQHFPGAIQYISRDSALFEIHASLMGKRFGDNDLAMLAPLKDRIVRADFSGTAITDASAPLLGRMATIERLRLANTKISNKTIDALATLKKLHSLTVTGAKVTQGHLAFLRQRGVVIYADSDVR